MQARQSVKALSITAERVRQVKGGPVPWDREVHGYRPGGVGEQVDGAEMHVEAASLPGSHSRSGQGYFSGPARLRRPQTGQDIRGPH